jgi:hypothetical protein
MIDYGASKAVHVQDIPDLWYRFEAVIVIEM